MGGGLLLCDDSDPDVFGAVLGITLGDGFFELSDDPGLPSLQLLAGGLFLVQLLEPRLVRLEHPGGALLFGDAGGAHSHFLGKSALGLPSFLPGDPSILFGPCLPSLLINEACPAAFFSSVTNPFFLPHVRDFFSRNLLEFVVEKTLLSAGEFLFGDFRGLCPELGSPSSRTPHRLELGLYKALRRCGRNCGLRCENRLGRRPRRHRRDSGGHFGALFGHDSLSEPHRPALNAMRLRRCGWKFLRPFEWLTLGHLGKLALRLLDHVTAEEGVDPVGRVLNILNRSLSIHAELVGHIEHRGLLVGSDVTADERPQQIGVVRQPPGRVHLPCGLLVFGGPFAGR